MLIALAFVFQMVSIIQFKVSMHTKFNVSLFQLFGGFLLTLDSLPVYIRWLQYLSLFRYAVEVLSVYVLTQSSFSNGPSL